MLFTSEQNLIRETARGFAARKIAPFAGSWETKGLDRKALLSELGGLGLMGVCVPTEWDGDCPDARVAIAGPELLAACSAAVERWEAGDLAEAARLCQAAIIKAKRQR